MTAEQPAILATSGSFRPGSRTRLADDGVGLVYHGTSLIWAVGDVRSKGAYIATCSEDAEGADEERLEPRYHG